MSNVVPFRDLAAVLDGNQKLAARDQEIAILKEALLRAVDTCELWMNGCVDLAHVVVTPFDVEPAITGESESVRTTRKMCEQYRVMAE